MDSLEGRYIATALANRVTTGTDVVQVSDALLSVWRDIDGTLTPILGKRGVAALYKRTLHICASSHPWLIPVRDGQQQSFDFDALGDVFKRQSLEEAGAAATTLIHAFCNLLTSLVGAALTDRLLAPILNDATVPPPQGLLQ